MKKSLTESQMVRFEEGWGKLVLIGSSMADLEKSLLWAISLGMNELKFPLLALLYR